MAVISTSAPQGHQSTRLDEYYSKRLLITAQAQLRLAKLCSQEKLPAKTGSTTLRVFKRSKADPSRVQKLTEGTPDGTYSNTEINPIDIPLDQYGDKVKITDVRTATDLLNTLDQEVLSMGEACAAKLDQVIRDEAVSANISEAVAGTKLYAQGLDSFDALFKQTDLTKACLTCADIKRAITVLKRNGAPKFEDGSYVAVVTNEQASDLMDDPVWQALNTHNRGGKAIYAGEIGCIFGTRVVETDVGFREKGTAGSSGEAATGEGTYAADGDIYTALVFGRQALGTCDIGGQPSANHPRFIYVDGPDKSDPLNQFKTAGWKGFFAAKLLDPTWLVTIRSKTAVGV